MRIAAISFLLLGLAICASAAPPAKETLWDFRDGNNVESGARISKDETNAVKKYLFSSRDIKGFDLASRVQGSFTRKGADQTLYYTTGCKEGGQFAGISECPHVSWHSEGWIAIYEGTKPVAKIREALGNRIGKAVDVNGDGLDEILSFAGWGGQGVFTDAPSLGSLAGGRYKFIKGFDGVADNCSAGSDVSSTEAYATRITYTPVNGKMPVFVTEYYQSKCEPREWKKTTKLKFARFKKENF